MLSTQQTNAQQSNIDLLVPISDAEIVQELRTLSFKQGIDAALNTGYTLVQEKSSTAVRDLSTAYLTVEASRCLGISGEELLKSGSLIIITQKLADILRWDQEREHWIRYYGCKLVVKDGRIAEVQLENH